MTEHAGIVWIVTTGLVVQLGGLALLALQVSLQVREAKKETPRLFTATAGMVHQDTATIRHTRARPRA